jgi:hypothetical protein
MQGIFCLEGFWYGDHRDQTSVHPVLELIHRINKIPFLHHRCCTREEFIYSLNRWKTKAFHSKYKILYIAFHGEKGLIKIGKESLALDELAETLGDKCQGSVIYFGSCSTLKLDKRLLKKFITKTKCLAVLGYKVDVDWLRSASFDIQMLGHLIEHPFDTKGIVKIKKAIQEDCKHLVRELDFVMEINEIHRFPRKRTKTIE